MTAIDFTSADKTITQICTDTGYFASSGSVGLKCSVKLPHECHYFSYVQCARSRPVVFFLVQILLKLLMKLLVLTTTAYALYQQQNAKRTFYDIILITIQIHISLYTFHTIPVMAGNTICTIIVQSWL